MFSKILHKIIRSVWLSAEKNITRIGDRSIYVNSQPGRRRRRRKHGNGTVTAQIFSICNNHTQQLPYSVCVRCHTAKLNKITQKVLEKKKLLINNSSAAASQTAAKVDCDASIANLMWKRHMRSLGQKGRDSTEDKPPHWLGASGGHSI